MVLEEVLADFGHSVRLTADGEQAPRLFGWKMISRLVPPICRWWRWPISSLTSWDLQLAG
jgi:hypothetical protein